MKHSALLLTLGIPLSIIYYIHRVQTHYQVTHATDCLKLKILGVTNFRLKTKEEEKISIKIEIFLTI